MEGQGKVGHGRSGGQGEMRPRVAQSLGLGSVIVVSGLLICVGIITKFRKSELLLPWYEVVSTGDGLGPETVNYWKVHPRTRIMCK